MTAAPAARPAAALRYDLAATLAPATHGLAVTGTFASARPRTRFYLNEDLVIDELADDSGPIAYRRDGSCVELDRPITMARFRYHGELVRKGSRDFKSQAWIGPGEVRLTELTLWYPVFYDGDGDFPWPPEPATGVLSVAHVEGLHWASSGVPIGPARFVMREPGDFVLAGVSTSPVSYAGAPALRVLSGRHAELVPSVRDAWHVLVHHLGAARTPGLSIVEFPGTDTTNRLAFLSSDLIVLNTAICDWLTQSPPQALRIVAHELAHRWFGGDLRATGPGARWLVESFAEYYAWGVIRARFGNDELRRIVDETTAQAGEVPTRISELGWDDERVYTAGALAVHALAEAVGPDRLDAAVQRLHETRSAWSVASLFAQLETTADPVRLATFRRAWGL